VKQPIASVLLLASAFKKFIRRVLSVANYCYTKLGGEGGIAWNCATELGGEGGIAWNCATELGVEGGIAWNLEARDYISLVFGCCNSAT